ncbi:MAG: PDZ domain-containing protein [Rhodospirillales bacterium]|nr:MAG: PDZ domain-containing protein [Rhodospirillales bacterium]
MIRRIPSLILIMVLITAGCGVMTDRPLETTSPSVDASTRTSAVLRAAYATILDRYVDPVTLPELVHKGLSGLSEVDPAVQVVDHGSALGVQVADTVVARIPAPARDDVAAWSTSSADVIAAVRSASPLVLSAGEDQVLDVVLKRTLSSLDSHSRYASADQAVGHRARRQGYGGVGIRFQSRDGHTVVTEVLAGSPAERAGVRVRDRISHIDGTDLAGASERQVSAHLRGPVGSRLSMTVLREGRPAPLRFDIDRSHFILPTVRLSNDEGILYVAVSGFNQDTARSLALALGSDLADASRGVVLDLRGNPGGLLHQSVLVADLFLAGGRIVMTQGRHPDSRQLYLADDDDVLAGAPVVVLLDGGSASAAEIVAAALKDRGRAVVLGTASYGKGTVQTVSPLPNDGELVLTWSRLVSPSGRIIGAEGVIPTLCTSGLGTIDSPDTDRLLRTALMRSPVPAGASRKDCPAARHANDVDVRIARALLTEPAAYRRFVLPGPAIAEVAGGGAP